MAEPELVRSALARVTRGDRLTEADAADAMLAIMGGDVPQAQVAGFAVALAVRGESVDELVGMARAARRLAVPVPYDGDLLDTCGSGGDGLGTFNISTAAAVVAAAAGAPVAKHGNRSASCSCGSADVLEELGVDIALGPADVARCLQTVGIAFLFAPIFHPAFRHVAATRRALGVRTVFNLLGPLCNPAGARSQALGVPRPELVAPMAEVLHRLGVVRAVVFHAEDGMDELSTAAPSQVVEILDGRRRAYRLDPASLGLPPARPGDLLGGDRAVNAGILRAVLDGRRGAARDVVLLNAAAALYAAGRAADLPDGIALARRAIDSGAARGLMADWVHAAPAARGSVPVGSVVSA